MLILLLISILATILSIAIYRRRPIQLALRLASIGLIYLLVTNYALRIPSGEKQRTPIVLIDHSKSMARSLPGILDAVTKIEFPHDLYFFSESLLTKTEPQRLGSYTDIGRAIRQAATMQPSLLLLVTDGNHNFGASPLSILDDVNVPVFVYGIGDETERDVSIIDVGSPAYAYPGDSTQIEVIVESSGYPTGTGRVTLNTATGKRLAAQTFPLSDVPARNRLTFWHIPSEPGTFTFNVEIGPMTDEMSYVNNKSAISLDVFKEKIRVLYYADHVSFNTKFILEALAFNANISTSSVVRKGPGRYSRLPDTNDNATLPDVAGFDVVILDNVNVGTDPWRNLPQLLDRGKGIVLIGLIENTNEQWRGIMPINTTGGLTEGNYEMEIMEPFSTLTVGGYPTVRSVIRVVGSKDDATIIARIKDLPVIGFRQSGKGKIFQLCVGDLGIWSFLLHGVKNKNLLNDLLGDIVRFLSPLGTHTRLALHAKRRNYQVGEIVQLTLQSYDRNFRSTGGGDFFLVAGDNKIPMYEARRGVYEASCVLQEEGTHTMLAQGELDGESLTSNVIEINVVPRSDEAEHMLNRTLLENIAARTNGKFLTLEESFQAEPLPSISEVHKESRVINLNSPVVYFLVLILLTVDWILRRRRGTT